MQKMKATIEKPCVLISGATGFIGHHLVSTLTANNVRCKVLVRISDPFINSKILHDDIYSGSFEDLIQNQKVFDGVDTVIHCAARVHNMQQTSNDELDSYRAINRDLTTEFAKNSLENGVKTFVFISTVKVMGDFDRTDKILTEEDESKPTDSYGISKYEAEIELKQLFANQTKTRCVILRLPMVYGPGNKGNMLFLLKAASKAICLPLKTVKGKRSLVYVGNVCAAIIKIIHGDNDNVSSIETFFITDGMDYTSGELYNVIYREMKGKEGVFTIPLSLLKIPACFNGKARKILSRLLDDYRFSSEKLQKEYKWVPPYSIKEGIAETVKWYKNLSMK
jgi:nucleoside-diphosphate-sugar epimerase